MKAFWSYLVIYLTFSFKNVLGVIAENTTLGTTSAILTTVSIIVPVRSSVSTTYKPGPHVSTTLMPQTNTTSFWPSSTNKPGPMKAYPTIGSIVYTNNDLKDNGIAICILNKGEETKLAVTKRNKCFHCGKGVITAGKTVFADCNWRIYTFPMAQDQFLSFRILKKAFGDPIKGTVKFTNLALKTLVTSLVQESNKDLELVSLSADGKSTKKDHAHITFKITFSKDPIPLPLRKGYPTLKNITYFKTINSNNDLAVCIFNDFKEAKNKLNKFKTCIKCGQGQITGKSTTWTNCPSLNKEQLIEQQVLSFRILNKTNGDPIKDTISSALFEMQSNFVDINREINVRLHLKSADGKDQGKMEFSFTIIQ